MFGKNKAPKGEGKNIVYVTVDNQLKKQNDILKEFIGISMNGSSVEKGCAYMLDVLKQSYHIDYCTLLIDYEGENLFWTAYTDVEKPMISSVEEFIKLKSKEKVDMQIFTTKGGCLSYPTADKRKIIYSALMPIKNAAGNIGVLFIEKTNMSLVKELEEESFKLIVETLTLGIENLLLHDRVKNMAIKDQLTKVYNRRYLYDDFLKEHKESNYSIAMIDIDFFKKVNDTYGHGGGDKVLIEVAKVIERTLGDKGTLFRYGGEEFLAYLPFINKKNALGILEIVRMNVENIALQYEDHLINVTISIGISDSSLNEVFDKVKDAADILLYESKEKGRNRIS